MSDPVTRFPHPANVRILACLQSGAVRSASPSVYNVDECVLRTHPDLSERLFDIAGPRATHCQDAAYGHPVLAASGVVFAVAVSMNALLFRLPEDCWALGVELGGKPAEGAGTGWMAFDAWASARPARQHVDDLRYWCERAFAHAVELARRQAGDEGCAR